MIVKRKLAVPGLSDVSSDSDSEEDGKSLLKYNNPNIKAESNVIMIEDSDLSDDDVGVISMEGIQFRRNINNVWRNIIECDLIDEGVKIIGLKSAMINREIESYELPPRKRMRYSDNKNVKSKKCKSRIRRKCESINPDDIICISSSSDELEIIDVQLSSKVNWKTEKNAEIALLVSDDAESDSLSHDDSTAKFNNWPQLIGYVENNEFQIEFEDNRRNVTSKIASELNEPKIELIDRCIIYLGPEKCRNFVEATKIIEMQGGLLTKDGSRRRTMGGVFLSLIKEDRSITNSIKKLIFAPPDSVIDESDGRLWWQSLDYLQRQRCTEFRGVTSYGRKSEFNSYTFLDLDYFEGIRDFRYRYTPSTCRLPRQSPPHSLDGAITEESTEELGAVASSPADDSSTSQCHD